MSFTLEEAKKRRVEFGPAAVDVSLLAPDVRAAFLAWLNADELHIALDEPQPQPSTSTSTSTAITEAWLTSIEGIGTKGAGAILEELAARGVTTFESFAEIRNLTSLPAIGKKNGAALRAALDAVAGDVGSLDEKRKALIANTQALIDNTRAKEIAQEHILSGVHDGALQNPYVDLSIVAKTSATYCYALAEKERLGLSEKPAPKDIPIFCPWCDALFDSAPARAYESGEAVCEVPDGEENCGQYCGQTFWLEATADGYRTHKSPDLIADGGEPEPGARKPRKALAVPLPERVHPALSACRVFAKTEAHTEEWHKARAAGVGSSDVGALLGVSPYATAHDVWEAKLGRDAERKPWLEAYAAFGTWFEPYIRQWAAQDGGIEIIDGAELGTLQSVIWPQALANIDGLDVINGVVEEYKTTTEKWAEIPEHYFSQVQHQMFVTGVSEIRLRQYVSPIDRKLIPSLLEVVREIAPSGGPDALAAWLLERGEIFTWIVERDDRYIERMLEREKAFWGFVEFGVEPTEAEPEGSADLSADQDVLAACEEYARLTANFDAQALLFLESEGVTPSKRGNAAGSADKLLSAAKKKARAAIERAVSLLEDPPKRVAVGAHSATLVDRGTHRYWNIYTGEADVPAI